ncbi:MAG TPA: hypothetical protein VFU14_18830 [Acidimicrobiales bacterium]|nr:hypothetical protein [Acidimicrobiales bacterium]
MRTKGWEGPVPVIAAVLVVAALSLLTVTVMSGFGPEDDDIALLDTEGYDPSTTTTSTTVRSTTTSRPRRSTTTVAPGPSTTDAPQVLGDVTTRVPGTSSSSGDPEPSPSTTTAAPRPSASPAASPSPTTAPNAPTTSPPAPTTTTTTTCWNSADPACGPLVWQPDPGPYDVKAYAVRVPSSAYVGEPVVFAVNRVEPAGDDAHGACTTWAVSDPGVVNTSSCEEVNRSCGRYGPHATPAASRDEVTHSHTVTFTTPGEHTVSVGGNTATQLADGCASPWLERWSRTYTVIVRER